MGRLNEKEQHLQSPGAPVSNELLSELSLPVVEINGLTQKVSTGFPGCQRIPTKQPKRHSIMPLSAVHITTQCFPPSIGGIENLMHGIASALARLGYPVTVYADSHPDAPKFSPAVNSGDYEIRRFGGLKPVRRWLKARAVQKAAVSGSVLIADTWKSLEFINPSVVEAKILCLAMAMEFPSEPSARKADRIRKTLAIADLLLPISSYTQGRAAPFCPPDLSVELFHPGFTPPKQLDDARAAELANVPEDARPALFTISRIESRKGHDLVLAALPQLRESWPNLHYFVAGSGPDQARLERIVEHTNLKSAVTFLGRVSEEQKAAWLQQSDLFVMPTRTEGESVEGFGLVYLEAASMGLTSIAGNDSGAQDAVLHRETGLLCDSSSVEELTASISAVLGDADLRQQLESAARSRVEAEFMWPAAIQRLTQWF